MRGGHGGYTDFRGANNTTFAMHSHTNLSVNTYFSEAIYTNIEKQRVNGTYMTEAYMIATASTGKELHISLKAGKTNPNHADVLFVASGEKVALDGKDTAQQVTEGNIKVAFSSAGEEGVKAIVTQLGRWQITVTSGAGHMYTDLSTGAGGRFMWRVDVNVKALSPSVEAEAVAPHGLIGQTFDGDNLAVDGAKDDYHKDKKQVVTSAQAKGAIEGDWTDYIVPSPFSTEFKFSRHHTAAAKPRDVTKLTGAKRFSKASLGSVANVWA